MDFARIALKVVKADKPEWLESKGVPSEPSKPEQGPKPDKAVFMKIEDLLKDVKGNPELEKAVESLRKMVKAASARLVSQRVATRWLAAADIDVKKDNWIEMKPYGEVKARGPGEDGKVLDKLNPGDKWKSSEKADAASIVDAVVELAKKHGAKWISSDFGGPLGGGVGRAFNSVSDWEKSERARIEKGADFKWRSPESV